MPPSYPTTTAPCPCTSGNPFADCCAPALHGAVPAATAEALMRSRYCAFACGAVDYLIASHHPSKRRDDDRQVLAQNIAATQWLGLQVIASGSDWVEFAAYYRDDTGEGQLHERSRFVHEDGRWYYLDGDMLPPHKPGRNEPCWCGSGKKFKRCHRG